MNIRNSAALLARTLSFLVLSNIGFTASAVAGDQDRAIIAATRKYLTSQSYRGEIKVTVEKVQGNYARVATAPKDQSIDPAIVFLRRDHGGWKGLAVGTGWDPEDLEKMHIPKSLMP